MKCDELKAEQWLDYSGEPMPCYPKATVDAAIEELKAAHHKERHEYIEMVAQLRQENAELKQKLESVQASMYCDVLDANMEIRRLKRALYKACANWAKYKKWDAFTPDKDWKKWHEMSKKCLKKAEEYK